MNNDMHIKEYELLRQEILQYMEEYQSVRNMMYVVTVSILAFSEKLNIVYYFYLMPLIVIIPSYVLYYSYNRCVAVASTYLQVFHESEDKSVGYQWEGRHAKFEKTYGDRKGLIWKIIDSFRGKLAFILCACACIIVYFYYANAFWADNSCTDNRIFWDKLIGICCLAITALIFIVLWKVKEKSMKETWEYLKIQETTKRGIDIKGESESE